MKLRREIRFSRNCDARSTTVMSGGPSERTARVRRTAVSCARLEKARTTSHVPTSDGQHQRQPVQGLGPQHRHDVPARFVHRKTALDAARKTLITACSQVAGVSGVPKHPQLDTEPWRNRMTTTKPAKTA